MVRQAAVGMDHVCVSKPTRKLLGAQIEQGKGSVGKIAGLAQPIVDRMHFWA